MKILLVEPFYTSSHKYWADHLVQRSRHDILLLTLPGKHWKWRMHHASISLANSYNDLNTEFDLILCTDMMNVALFKSLVEDDIPIWTYYHENQLTYPWSETDQDPSLNRDYHYGWINYTSALVSGRVLFNSKYNRDSFYKAIADLIQRMPDYNEVDDIELLIDKTSVLPIGIDQNDFNIDKKPNNETPIILWNHRWEYDKNPELFFETLFRLKETSIPFQLIVCGEHYAKAPAIYSIARHKLADEIIHWGFAESRSSYLDLLHKADIYPVTCNQDFFGISVIEAIAAGATPLLPNRLSYPEHLAGDQFKDCYYHNADELYNKLVNLLTDFKANPDPSIEILGKYNWDKVIGQYDELFEVL